MDAGTSVYIIKTQVKKSWKRAFEQYAKAPLLSTDATLSILNRSSEHKSSGELTEEDLTERETEI